MRTTSSLQFSSKMLVILFVLWTWSESCQSQVVYMPRYFVRPVRGSAMEALERLRLPVARYFPQVETPVGYRMSEYKVPPQFVEEYAQPQEEEEYGGNNYEYDFSPVYRPTQYGEEVYAQQQEPVEEPNSYNDMMERYLMERPKEDMFDIERRSHPDNSSSAPTTSTSAPQVEMTAVPASPEKKDVKSMVVVPDHVEPRGQEEVGQKEEPLFRPLQNSQRTFWNGFRVKNNQQHKSPIPLLKKMITNSGDPLLDELNSLKKKD